MITVITVVSYYFHIFLPFSYLFIRILIFQTFFVQNLYSDFWWKTGKKNPEKLVINAASFPALLKKSICKTKFKNNFEKLMKERNTNS